MPHALPDFEALYQRCVARVDVNELVVLLDMVGWDDLGGRVWERAIVVASAQLRGSGVFTSGKNDSKQLLLPEDSAATKENLSSSKALHPTPWIDSWAKHWYLWVRHRQNPDGLFSVRLATEQGAEEELIICYECDADSKSERKEMRKVAMKMWQAVDAARWTRDGSQKRRTLSCYTVRSNVYRSRKSKESDPVKRGLAWLYRFMCAHIKCYLLLVDDWLATKKGREAHPDDPAVLPRERDQVWDHHFFIGVFVLPHEHDLSMVPADVWNEAKPQSSNEGGAGYTPGWYTAAKFAGAPGDEGNEYNGGYLRRTGKTPQEIIQFDNLPLPLVCEDDRSTVITFQQDFKRHWKASMKKRAWSLEVSSLSMRRVDVQAVTKWAQLPEGERWKSTNSDKINGLWYLTDVKEFLEFFCTNRHTSVWTVFNLVPANWPNEVRKRQISNTTPLLQRDSIARLIQNAMTELETVLLGALKTNAGWGVDVLKWDLSKYGDTVTETVKDDKGILTEIKKALRDNPNMLRQRSAQKGTGGWEEYDRRNGTLRSAVYRKLHKDLPELSPEVSDYLDTFQVPNAKLFFRLVRCNSILALRELARQVAVKRVDISHHLGTLDTCVQSEVNMIFDRVRENLDVYVGTADVQHIADATADETRRAMTETDVLLKMADELGFVHGDRFAALGEAMRRAQGVELDDAFFEVYDMIF